MKLLLFVSPKKGETSLYVEKKCVWGTESSAARPPARPPGRQPMRLLLASHHSVRFLFAKTFFLPSATFVKNGEVAMHELTWNHQLNV